MCGTTWIDEILSVEKDEEGFVLVVQSGDCTRRTRMSRHSLTKLTQYARLAFHDELPEAEILRFAGH